MSQKLPGDDIVCLLQVFLMTKGRKTDEPRRKYQFMEVNQQRRAAGLKDKMPDIQKTLETVRFLKSRKVCQKV